jgi:hypothetical protein
MRLIFFLHELGFPKRGVTIIFSDSQGSLVLIKNPAHHKRTKHINIQHHYIREMMNTKEVFFLYCPTSNMGINALTKLVPTPKHSKCMQLLGLDRKPINLKSLTKWECK